MLLGEPYSFTSVISRIGLFTAMIAYCGLLSAEHAEVTDSSGHFASPNHLSLFLGNTHLQVPGESDEDAFTLGIDYEYRVSKRIGVGGVAEYAFGGLDATTLLAAVDVHLYKGAVMQLGLGVEFVDDQTNELGRVGILYEFEFSEITVSPQFHFDVTSAEDSLVFGLAVGRNF